MFYGTNLSPKTFNLQLNFLSDITYKPYGFKKKAESKLTQIIVTILCLGYDKPPRYFPKYATMLNHSYSYSSSFL